MPKYDKKLDRADKIAGWRLCMGCGACKWACPNNAITLKDVIDQGIRPFVDESKCEKCGSCAEVCPGISLEHEMFPEDCIDELRDGWGPILEIQEGYAVDEQIRYAGSSGGMATALALYGLESGIAGGVLHIGVDKDNPIRNVPVYSTTKEQLLACSGSRYAPAAPCQSFNVIKRQTGKSIFIGKPCDVAALSKARKFDAELDKKVALTISIFCAGTPTRAGTLAVLEEMGVSDVSELESFRYRGNGWPGKAAARVKGQTVQRTMSYEKAWGDILSNHGQIRCRLCPDSTGEFADIACGDPWYREIEPDDPGRSLVLVRTEKGKEILNKTIKSGHIELSYVCSETITLSQKSLLNKRCNIWGRLLTMRIMRIPVPYYRGFSLFVKWNKLSMADKIHSICSTIKRILIRKWNRPLKSVEV